MIEPRTDHGQYDECDVAIGCDVGLVRLGLGDKADGWEGLSMDSLVDGHRRCCDSCLRR